VAAGGTKMPAAIGNRKLTSFLIDESYSNEQLAKVTHGMLSTMKNKTEYS
jgi:hypothetical protein